LGAGENVTLQGYGTYIFQVGTALDLAGTVVLAGGATAGNVIWLVGSSATVGSNASAAGSIIAQVSVTLASGAALDGRAIALGGTVSMSDNAVTTEDTIPSVYWAYNTVSTILNSPALSLDGKQVMFVQTDGSGQSSLVLLKWAASSTDTVGAPTRLTRVLHADYPSCTAPCMTTGNLHDLTGADVSDTNSSVFYDYSGDAAYVGDDAGLLHKFTPVLKGLLTEVKTGGWPAQVNLSSPTALGSLVHDFASGNVFVSDTGGFFYRVDSLTAAVTSSARVDFSGSIVQAPIVDSTAGLAYVFVPTDGSQNCAGAACAAVFEFTTTFPLGSAG
jgi:Ice-binding-like